MSNAPPSAYSASSSRSIRHLIERGLLQPHFQPIAELQSGSIHAHEALIRGPAHTPFATADALFAAARREDIVVELELECVRLSLEAWAAQPVGGRLFVNLSAAALVHALRERPLSHVLSAVVDRGVALSTLVIELTEHERVEDLAALLKAVAEIRQAGVGVALDDFGDGRSSLRLWSELRPDIVKIDKYFAQGVAENGDKLQTMRALLALAETFGSQLVAEGIETDDALRTVRDLGFAYGQGWFIGRPAPDAVRTPAEAAARVLESKHIAVFPERRTQGRHSMTAARLLVAAPSVNPRTTHEELYALFEEHDGLHAVAVVENRKPIALVSRAGFIGSYARPYFKELYGRQPCTLFANLSPLTLEMHAGIEELTAVLTSADQRYLNEGFVIVEDGQYRGLGTGQQLVRSVTEARIEAARHANPLTLLPGNIPLTDHIERLLAGGSDFVAAYADLNQFKPYNDLYGYWRGDEMIRLVSATICAHVDPRRDFVGHVGGDDFVVLFQSTDWLQRCEDIVRTFNARARDLFDAAALQAGGIMAEDRHGNVLFHPLTTLCIGAIPIPPDCGHRAEDVASLAAVAKRRAKHDAMGLLVLDVERATL